MSEMYDEIKKWIFKLSEDTIVGETSCSNSCLVATFLGRSLKSGDFEYVLPYDVVSLSIAFDRLGSIAESTPITAQEACELFREKKSLTEENAVV